MCAAPESARLAVQGVGGEPAVHLVHPGSECARVHSVCPRGSCLGGGLDIEAFFERVNHDVLIRRLMRDVQDRRTLKLINRTANAPCNAGTVP